METQELLSDGVSNPQILEEMKRRYPHKEIKLCDWRTFIQESFNPNTIRVLIIDGVVSGIIED